MGELVRCAQRVSTICGLALLVSSTPARAGEPRVQIGPYVGYQFGGSLDATSQYEKRHINIQDAPTFGATLNFAASRDGIAEIGYSRTDTEISVHSTDGSFEKYDLAINYLTIGGLLEFRIPGAEWLRPVIGGTMGPSWFEANNEYYSYEEWRFSLLMEGGLKMQIVDHLGVRFRARLLTTFFTDHSALFCGSGTGCAYTFSGTALFQGEVGAGVYVAF